MFVRKTLDYFIKLSSIVLLSFATLRAQSYSLVNFKELALTKNKIIKESKLEYEAAVQVKNNAFTNYFPMVSASGISMKAHEDLIQANMMGMPISMLDELSVGSLTAVQPIYAGGRIIAGNNLAELGKEVNSEQMVLNKSNVLRTVEEKYWQIYQLTEKMKTVDAYEKMINDLYKEANDACKAGLILRNDLLKIALKQNEIRLNKLQLGNGIKLAKKSLCQYTGLPIDGNIMITDTIGSLNSPETVFLKKDAVLHTRIEYRLLKKKLEAEKLQTQLKIGEFLPTVSAGVTGSYMILMDENKSDLIAFANVSVPLSGWWGGSYTIQEREIKEKIAQNEVNDNIEMLGLQIDKNWDDLLVAYQQIGIAEATVTQAEENLKINRENYKSGMINISDMLEAQALLQSGKERLIETKTAYKTLLNDYLQNTGRYN